MKKLFVLLISFILSAQVFATGPDCYPDYSEKDPLKNPMRFEMKKKLNLRGLDGFTISHTKVQGHGKPSFTIHKNAFFDSKYLRIEKFRGFLKLENMNVILDFLKRFQALPTKETISAEIKMKVVENSVYDYDYCEYTGETEFDCSFYLVVPEISEIIPELYSQDLSKTKLSHEQCIDLFNKIKYEK